MFKGQEIRLKALKNYGPIKKNTLRAKWAEELEAKVEELSNFYKYKVINKRYIVKAELSLLI